MRYLPAVILASFCLLSCDKRELPVKPYQPEEEVVIPGHEPGPLLTTRVDMEKDYRNQIWYSLQKDSVISMNLKTDWDLAFESSPEGWRIMLNGAKAMRAYRTTASSLAEVQSTGSDFATASQADMPSGNPDSTAIGNWKESNPVYIINRGYGLDGKTLEHYKLKIISEDAASYTFEYAALKSTEVLQGTVYKNGEYNYTAFSFESRRQLTIEPKKTDYDLCFTQYTHLFLDPVMYYQVSGVLHNAYNTRVARIPDKDFRQITIADTMAYHYETRRDRIGYDWKSFDLNRNLYTVNTRLCYIIHDSRGVYYKLRFIDFLNAGVPGYPRFEFRRL
jgi:hypothetical protein